MIPEIRICTLDTSTGHLTLSKPDIEEFLLEEDLAVIAGYKSDDDALLVADDILYSYGWSKSEEWEDQGRGIWEVEVSK